MFDCCSGTVSKVIYFIWKRRKQNKTHKKGGGAVLAPCSQPLDYDVGILLKGSGLLRISVVQCILNVILRDFFCVYFFGGVGGVGGEWNRCNSKRDVGMMIPLTPPLPLNCFNCLLVENCVTQIEMSDHFV